MTKTQISTRLIDDAIDRAGAYEVQVRRNYGGRAMYGDTCFGLVGSQNEITKVMIALAVDDVDLALNLADNTSRDNMGYDTIVYFRGYELDGEPSSYEDD